MTTEQTREVMTEFTRLMYVERDVARAFETCVADDYIQHNPAFEDGREAAIAGLKAIFGPPESVFEVQRLLVDGDFAAIHVRAQPAGRPLLAVSDFYRIADGLIAEHWDVIQPVPDTAVSSHPMF